VFCASFGARCVCVDKAAVFSAQKRSIIDYCKIRYVSKFAVASRGSRCDSTAFLLLLVVFLFIFAVYVRISWLDVRF